MLAVGSSVTCSYIANSIQFGSDTHLGSTDGTAWACITAWQLNLKVSIEPKNFAVILYPLWERRQCGLLGMNGVVRAGSFNCANRSFGLLRAQNWLLSTLLFVPHHVMQRLLLREVSIRRLQIHRDRKSASRWECIRVVRSPLDETVCVCNKHSGRYKDRRQLYRSEAA